MAKQTKADAEASQNSVPAVTEEQYTQTELQKFNPIKGAIQTYRENYLGLTINGIEDKEGYKKVHEARMVVKTARVNVDKTRKALNETAQTFIRNVNDYAKNITAELNPIEEYLEEKEFAIDKEIEEHKQALIRQEEERIQGRVTRLLANGLAFDGANYWYNELRISSLAVKQKTDLEFEAFMETVKGAKEAEKERLEAERLELEKQENERKAEQQRLAEQKAEQDKKEQELKDRLAELERRENELKEAEAKRLRERSISRVAMIKDQMQWDAFLSAYKYGNIVVLKTDIEGNTDEDFASLVKGTLDAIAKAKDEEEKEKERLAKEKAEQAIKDAQAKEEQRKKDEAEKERKRKEREERRLARRPDKEKLEEFITNLPNIELPAVKANEYKTIVAYIQNEFAILATTVNSLISKIEDDGKEE